MKEAWKEGRGTTAEDGGPEGEFKKVSLVESHQYCIYSLVTATHLHFTQLTSSERGRDQNSDRCV